LIQFLQVQKEKLGYSMDPELVARTLNFHGQQLTKLWESEHGTPAVRDLDYEEFSKRSKDLGFQDRAKRIKLHQFMVDKASSLFKSEKNSKDAKTFAFETNDEDYCPMVPPLEFFIKPEKSQVQSHFFSSLRLGDILIGQVIQKSFHGIVIRIIATGNGTRLRDVSDLSIKGSVHADDLVAAYDRKDGSYANGDLVRCEVIEFSADKLSCGMKGIHQVGENRTQKLITFGLITKEQLPMSYRVLIESTGKSYEECLKNNRTFLNPSAIEYMSEALGLDIQSSNPCSFLRGLNVMIGENESADSLRKIQNGKWALKSVAEGIKFFKAGQESEAFQCLNKALHIDPINVEGLVARGAL